MSASNHRGLIVLNIMLLALFLNPGSARPARLGTAHLEAQAGASHTRPVKNARRLTSLDTFVQRVANGQAQTLAGIYFSQDTSYPVRQQPAGDDVYVYEQPGVVTQYRMANRFGAIGILAHNTRAGSSFLKLRINQPITLVYGDGSTRQFQVASIKRFQALDSESPYSDFVEVNHPDVRLSSGDLFSRMYTQQDEVVLQTCLEKGGNPSWGRIFITAAPRRIQAVSQAFLTSPVAYGR